MTHLAIDPLAQFPTLAEAVLGFPLSTVQVQAFALYAERLLEWNAHTNLTAIRDLPGIYSKHFLDAFSALQAQPNWQAPLHVIDVGSGAGLPGLALAIICPHWQVTLNDAVGKKCRFLQAMCDELGLTQVRVVHARAEDLGQDRTHRQAYDWVTARAVARLPILLEYLLPLAKMGGRILAMKGETAMQELADSQPALKLLGASGGTCRPVQVPGISETRYLVDIPKTRSTPREYPRKAGVAERKPLGVPLSPTPKREKQ
ncbi:MAG TPA: 16S rRNA (guanine(527)-N(7))-methyltransferase RsmG [Anaerolineales bacterium]|nr:16S rRNA (guanine(527)-N(7))-methyltransferase RsmG [Anaerolineales bacterium]